MKTNHALLAVLLAALPAASVHAAPVPPAAEDPRLTVTFFEPEKFTDVKQSQSGSDRERDGLLTQIREYLADRARHYVPLGQMLEITFTDIDMAGEYEPWRGGDWQDVRIVKDIYPPRLSIAFRLVDAEGNFLKQGKRELRDLSFLMKIPGVDRSDPLRHEKALLDDWLGQEFGRVRKG